MSWDVARVLQPTSSEELLLDGSLRVPPCRTVCKFLKNHYRNNDLIRSFGYHTELLDPERERLNAMHRNFLEAVRRITELHSRLQRDFERLGQIRTIENRRVIEKYGIGQSHQVGRTEDSNSKLVYH
ncbi:hypothetical protein TNCV_3866531 [Trichonephila clavipes]|nr:hypothetical protein TNCV_3866531 [Trichonephila clavipes]